MPSPFMKNHGAIVTVIFLGITFILAASFAGLTDDREDKAESTDATIGYEANDTLLRDQRTMELWACILSAISFFMCLGTLVVRRRHHREAPLPAFIVCLALLLVAGVVAMTFTNLALPTNPRVALGSTLLAVCFVDVVLLALLLRTASACRAPVLGWTETILEQAKAQPESMQPSLGNNGKSREPGLPMTLGELQEELATRDAREQLFRAFIRSRYYLLALCVTMLIIAVVNVIKETTVFESRQPAFFHLDDIKAMNSRGNVDDLYRSAQRTGDLSPPKRVLLFVLDGLREDRLQANKDFKTYVNDPIFAKDATVLRSRNGLPSMSNPNWVTILTGALPEMHGTMGNLFAAQVQFDTIFAEANRFNSTRGITGSPDFATLVESDLPLLNGDGTVSPYVTLDGSKQMKSAALADSLRFKTVKRAMSKELGIYDLFLCHFSNIDIQGHNYGVTPEWNKQDTYNKAVSTTVGYLREIQAMLDDDTVMIISSDHGHVDSGGHGGVRSVLRNVPLLIYRKNSGLGSQPPSTTIAGAKIAGPHNTDISVSVSALLGVPIPRQAIGVPIPVVFDMLNGPRQHLVLQDLHQQKLTLLDSMIAKLGSPPLTPQLIDIHARRNQPKSAQELISEVQVMLSAYATYRDSSLSLKLRRNIIISLMGGLVVVTAVLLVSHNFSFTRPFSIVHRTKNVPESAQELNVRGFLVALLHCIAYYALCIIAIIIWAASHGYPWDSTMVHDLPHFIRWLIFVLVVGIFIEYFLVRAYHVRYSDRPLPPWPGASNAAASRRMSTVSVTTTTTTTTATPGSTPGSPVSPSPSTAAERIRLDSADRVPPAMLSTGRKVIVYATYALRLVYHYAWDCTPQRAQWDKIYIIRWYTAVLAACAIQVVVVLQVTMAFLNPFGFQLEWITPEGWGFRFRVLCMQYFSVPLIFGSVVVMWLFPRHDNAKSQMDALYLLGIDKFAKPRSVREEPLLSF